MRGNRRPLGRVEDYTIPFLVSFYVLVLMGLCTIWAIWGYPVALFVAFGVHLWLARILSSRNTLT